MTLLASCISNDIPYPRIQANFTTFAVDGESQSASIDTEKRMVTVFLPETVNPYQVKVSSFALDPADASVVGNALDASIDLSTPFDVTLRLYQDYVWTIQAAQSVERYFTFENQIGTSSIDPANHRVVAYLAETTPLSAVKVLTFKLGPEGCEYSHDLAGQVVDFTEPVEITVTAFDHPEQWTIYIETTESSVTTTSVDAWTCVAWVHGVAEVGKDNGVEYRQAGATDWTRVPSADVSHEEGAFTARITGLQPATDYEARAYSDKEYGATLQFTTGVEAQVPNASLSDWWLDGKVWCPWIEGGEQYWDTGNRGAATLGQSNSIPTTDTSTGTGHAAMLQTKFVGVAGLGKLAAGNIFTGKYVRTDGTNGVLAFGQPFTQLPTKLRCHVKYHSEPISHTSKEFADYKGQPDTCTVWIALIDSAEPFEIRTNPSNRQLFDPDGAMVVAYGMFQSGKDITDYTTIDVPLEYRSTSRVPTRIIIVGSSSKYGDYFTGGNGSVLYLDDIQLLYDY